jgi:hypothetical protein
MEDKNHDEMDVGRNGEDAVQELQESPGGAALQQENIRGENHITINIDAGVVGTTQEPETGHSPLQDQNDETQGALQGTDQLGGATQEDENNEDKNSSAMDVDKEGAKKQRPKEAHQESCGSKMPRPSPSDKKKSAGAGDKRKNLT